MCRIVSQEIDQLKRVTKCHVVSCSVMLCHVVSQEIDQLKRSTVTKCQVMLCHVVSCCVAGDRPVEACQQSQGGGDAAETRTGEEAVATDTEERDEDAGPAVQAESTHQSNRTARERP